MMQVSKAVGGGEGCPQLHLKFKIWIEGGAFESKPHQQLILN